MAAVRVAINLMPLMGKSEGVRRYIREIEPRISRMEGVQSFAVGGHSGGSGVRKILLAPKIGFVVRFIIETIIDPVRLYRSVDMFHYTDTYGPLIRTRPYVITVHDTTFLTHADVHDGWVAKWLSVMAHLTWKRAKLIIAVSETTAQDLIDAGIPSHKIRVIKHGIDHASFRQIKECSRPLSGRRYIAYLGNVEPRKGVGDLVEAFKAALVDLPDDIDLLIAGKNAWGPRVEDIVGSASGRIVMLGPLPDSGLASYLRNAEVLVYPSKYEGFGLPPLEAVSVGTRVLVGDTPVARETLGPYADYFAPGDIGQLAGQLTKLLHDDPDQGAADRIAYSRRFTWDSAAERTVAVYREVVR